MSTEEKVAHLKWKLVGEYATQEIEGIAYLALIWVLKRLKTLGKNTHEPVNKKRESETLAWLPTEVFDYLADNEVVG